MNKLTVLLVAVLSLFAGLTAKAFDGDGFRAGLTGSTKLESKDIAKWSVGVSASYKWHVYRSLFVLPEVCMEYLSAAQGGDYLIGVPLKGLDGKDKPCCSSSIIADFGVDVGSGFSFFTGPEIRLVVKCKKYTEINNPYCYWGFGVNKDFKRVYVNVRYNLSLRDTEDYKRIGDQLRFAVGFCF